MIRPTPPDGGPLQPTLPLPRLRRLLLIATALSGAIFAARDAVSTGATAPGEVTSGERADAASGETSDPFFKRSWITPQGHTLSAHGSAVCALPNGDICAVWYGGTREGAADVALFMSRFNAATGEWRTPSKVVDRALAESELDRRIKKLGNVVIFTDPRGILWMVYVSVSIGGWSGSAINFKTSTDEGLTWSESQRLTVNPFFNISSLVRNKPIFAADGRIGLPIYHELATKFPQMLWITPGPNGTIEDYRIRNLPAEAGMIQPSLVPLGGDRVLMTLRDSSDTRRMHTAYSDDNGWSWSAAETTNLPNPDSAIDALRLRDGRVLLAYNDSEHSRESLRLAVSADGGKTWQPGPLIETARRKEYSYPQLAEDAHGRIHLTYTWQRERIRHVEFNLAWFDQETGVRPNLAKVR